MATKKKTELKLSEVALEMYVVLVHTYGPANTVIKKIDSVYTEEHWADVRAMGVRQQTGVIGSSVETYRVNWPVV